MTSYTYWPSHEPGPTGEPIYDLVEYPGFRTLASGSFESVQAAARLFGLSPKIAHVRYLPKEPS